MLQLAFFFWAVALVNRHHAEPFSKLYGGLGLILLLLVPLPLGFLTGLFFLWMPRLVVTALWVVGMNLQAISRDGQFFGSLDLVGRGSEGSASLALLLGAGTLAGILHTRQGSTMILQAFALGVAIGASFLLTAGAARFLGWN